MNKKAPPSRICLGRITSAHGIKGEVKALVAVDDLETLAGVETLELNGVPYSLLSARFQKNSLVLNLAGVDTRDQAEKLVGQEIWIDPERLPRLPAGEYYWFEIVGLKVVRADTKDQIGTVTAIMPTPGHDIYVVQDEGREYFLPAVAEVILAVEPEHGRIVIAPEGWAALSSAH